MLANTTSPIPPEAFVSTETFIVHTSKSEYLGQSIHNLTGYPVIPIIYKKFQDGESYYRINIPERTSLVGRNVVIVSSIVDDMELLEVVRIGGELSELGTKRRIFVIPYLMYSTMERAVKPGEVVTCKSTVRMLCGIPSSGLGNLFMLMDLHTSGIIHYFEGTVQAMELYAEPVLEATIAQNIDFNEPCIFGSADLGRPLWVETFANKFNVGMAFIRKSRSFEDTHVVGEPIGDVKGKHVIIYDDMTRTAGTLIKACNAYLDNGAKKVTAVLTHLCLIDEVVIQSVIDSRLDKVIATNTSVRTQLPKIQNSKKFIICDVSPVFANQIKACLSHI
ncbi:ribose-phosphate pyrophosphokinase, putative [Entamoeba invadens IP1]|uniref:ribose-phosphate diphosphokinase n=2 Tax=Entamoeba invadens TaxID=33085 RepID=A0A0A1UAG3_ENTIV|nr:ribose-phosphate pyrophosphokinase, putative [Entamoeba invadens IP1]ELP91985.1 ribose-phosphate pyrophosphokinase, putative [Entamoeba invadens IP1]BAN42196.1 ribose-phosphate pyrophosphokinase, putative [Entamoeba invadens]|eukprot:XP_004258756.1 ribose-phosphate pyrophosphokinase, putative [Entamoeba invadens IP1]